MLALFPVNHQAVLLNYPMNKLSCHMVMTFCLNEEINRALSSLLYQLKALAPDFKIFPLIKQVKHSIKLIFN